MIKKTKKLINQLKPFWKEMRIKQSLFYRELFNIEKRMAKETKIKDIDFFSCDGEIVGIGNATRTMKLIHDSELEG